MASEFILGFKVEFGFICFLSFFSQGFASRVFWLSPGLYLGLGLLGAPGFPWQSGAQGLSPRRQGGINYSDVTGPGPPKGS